MADASNINSTASDKEDITTNFAVIHDIATGTGTPFGPSSEDIAEFAAYEAVPEATLLFLRGYASPQWLNAVGEKHNVSPELYRRHLQDGVFTSGGRDFHSSPSLPSSSARVFQLTIPTICLRNVTGTPYEPEDLQKDRQLESEAIGKHFQQLRCRGKVADSVVRRCLLLSKEKYVLEQTVSIEIGPPGDTWRAVVWLDSGKDLSQSVKGPWSPRPSTLPWETYFFPVIVHQADGTLSTTPMASTTSSKPTFANNRPAAEWKAAQNICLFPFQYGSRLDKDLARHDALYALSELFRFAAFSEIQFLNLLHSRIEHELSFVGHQNVGRRDAVSLLNLKYIKTQLTSHAQGLAETVSILENRDSLDWPRADSTKAENAAHLLLTDFKYLLQRAEALARECEHGMDTLANSSVLDESRRSTENALRVQKLTLLATVFIPLSFVCSIFGMNFKQLGSGSLNVWIWFAVAGPVILFSLLVYHFEVLVRLFGKIKSKIDR